MQRNNKIVPALSSLDIIETKLRKFPIALLEVNIVEPELISQKLLDWIHKNAEFPFQEVPYLNMYSRVAFAKRLMRHVFVMEGQKILAYFPIERINGRDKLVAFMGSRTIFKKQEVTKYCDPVFAPDVANNTELLTRIFLVLVDFFTKDNIRLLRFDHLQEDSAWFKFLVNYTGNFRHRIIRMPGLPGMRFSVATEAPAHYFNLDVKWSGLLKELDINQRESYEKSMKKLNNVKHSFEYDLKPTPDLLAEFIRIYKHSASPKDHFMSSRMEAFLHELAAMDFTNWEMRICVLKIFGENAGMLFYFNNTKQLLIYCSAFDKNFKLYRPDMLSLASLLKVKMDIGLKKLDMLTEKNTFGVELGAVPMKMFQVTVSLEM